jgi:hypothetical protein
MVPVGSDVAGSYVATPEEIFVTILFACLDVMQVVRPSFSMGYSLLKVEMLFDEKKGHYCVDPVLASLPASLPWSLWLRSCWRAAF